MSDSSYMDQYERMKRYYLRFKNINDGSTHEENTDYKQDDVYSFFIHCYQLKDWIQNDTKSGIVQKLVERFVHQNESLKICGDICNGIKHFVLDQPKMGTGASILKSNYVLNLGAEPTIKIKYKVIGDNKEFDAFTVATEAINLWDKFLSEQIKDFKAEK